MINFWINSNSGDYVIESDGMYRLFLIARYHDPIVGCGVYMPPEIIEITPTQFSLLQGFVPIKAKKLFNNRVRKVYAPTISNGVKGKSERISLPTKSETRDLILKKLGL